MRQAKKSTFKTILYYVVMIGLAFCALAPFAWLLYSAFMPSNFIQSGQIANVAPTLENFTGLNRFMSLPVTMKNTVLIALGSVLIDVLVSSLCAYPLAVMDFPGKKLITSLLIGTMIFPAAAGMVINYMTISRMHLTDTMLGAILPGCVHPFSILILRQSIRMIPRDAFDAARIDGAGTFDIFRYVVLPGMSSGIGTVALFDFINSWNSFLWPQIVLQETEKYPLATMLRHIYGSFGKKSGYIAAGTVISLLPVVGMVLIIQRQLMKTAGSALSG